MGESVAILAATVPHSFTRYEGFCLTDLAIQKFCYLLTSATTAILDTNTTKGDVLLISFLACCKLMLCDMTSPIAPAIIT